MNAKARKSEKQKKREQKKHLSCYSQFLFSVFILLSLRGGEYINPKRRADDGDVNVCLHVLLEVGRCVDVVVCLDFFLL
jgi:hypothetical protein